MLIIMKDSDRNNCIKKKKKKEKDKDIKMRFMKDKGLLYRISI